MSSTAAAGVSVGLRARRVFEVVEFDTAIAVGSGSVPALGTPRLLAWLEAVTVAAIEPALAPTEVSVGTHVDLDHLQPSPVGARVAVEAVVTAIEGLRVDCDVEATNGDGTLVGRARISRRVVNRERFLDRLGPGNPG
ncbi:MAG: thioesterase [Geodermatophilaceae bacterium]|nr:thioesterase [Geodermatophilaceae bacterium]